MKATIYWETSPAKEHKKYLTVSECGIEGFKFSNGWELKYSDFTDSFVLYGLEGRLARYCCIEIG